MTNFVLLHGSYQGGWIWQPVAQRLRDAGHLVYAPTLDGCGERKHAVRAGITNATHGAEIAELLFYEDLRDVVLVGTSCGGMVMTQAAELARNRIGRLVFADALALMDGESLSDIVRRPAAVTTELTTGVSPGDVSGRLFKDLDPATREWAAARITMHPIAAMRDPMVLQSFWQLSWKATVIWCRQSANPPVAHQKRAADALSASWHEIDTGHYPMLSTPDELSRIILL